MVFWTPGCLQKTINWLLTAIEKKIPGHPHRRCKQACKCKTCPHIFISMLHLVVLLIFTYFNFLFKFKVFFTSDLRSSGHSQEPSNYFTVSNTKLTESWTVSVEWCWDVPWFWNRTVECESPWQPCGRKTRYCSCRGTLLGTVSLSTSAGRCPPLCPWMPRQSSKWRTVKSEPILRPEDLISSVYLDREWNPCKPLPWWSCFQKRSHHCDPASLHFILDMQ